MESITFIVTRVSTILGYVIFGADASFDSKPMPKTASVDVACSATANSKFGIVSPPNTSVSFAYEPLAPVVQLDSCRDTYTSV